MIAMIYQLQGGAASTSILASISRWHQPAMTDCRMVTNVFEGNILRILVK